MELIQKEIRGLLVGYIIRKTVKASSFLNPFFPEKAINGILDNANRWTTQEPTGWLELDLGCPCLVTGYKCDFLGTAKWFDVKLNVSSFEIWGGDISGSTPNMLLDSVNSNTLGSVTKTINPVKTRKILLKIKQPGIIPNLMTSSVVNFDVTARPLGESALLANITNDKLNITPSFQSNITTYTIDGKGGSAIVITPVAVDINATIVVNGEIVKSGNASKSINISPTGDTTIEINVTSEDGINKCKYILTVKNTPKTLTNITAKTGDGKAITLNPIFDPTKKDYAGEVEFSDDNFNVQSISVIPSADQAVKISYKGQTITSGSEITIANPVVGDNIFEITASNSDGTLPSIYKVNIVRKHSLYIKTIVSTPGTVTPTISKSVNEYNIKGGRTATKVLISISAEDNSTKILVDIDGNKIEGTGGNISFETGVGSTVKQANVTVISNDGTSQKSYTLNIIK